MSSTTDTIFSSSDHYLLPAASDRPDEAQRLDDQHNGIKSYFGGALSLAPLDSTPKAILELGSGSGAWAIQAAEQFPDAEVLAVDLAPMPPRPLPPNLKFQRLDLRQPWPFEPETFDIVHARFLLPHLPQPQDVLNRMVELLRPGGWLLLEDGEPIMHADGDLSPAQKEFWEAVHTHVRNVEGSDPLAAVGLEETLKASRTLSEVHVHKLAVPFSGGSTDEKLNALGSTTRTSIYKLIQLISQDLDITSIGERARAEMRDPKYRFHVNLFFTWARKQL